MVGRYGEGVLVQVGSITTTEESLSQKSGLSLGEGGALSANCHEEKSSMKPATTIVIVMRRILRIIWGASKVVEDYPIVTVN